MGSHSAADALRAAAILHRVSQGGGPVRRARGRLPARYTSPNAPEKRDVLGTTMFSVLAGHKRYAHITALRGDGVLRELLGMKQIVSEDAVRLGFKAIGEIEGREWLQHHLDYCPAPLLSEPWILDADFDRQAALRPSGRGRAWLQSQKARTPQPCLPHLHDGRAAPGADVEVAAGNELASKHAAPVPGRSWIAFRAIAGRHFCAATAASVRKR